MELRKVRKKRKGLNLLRISLNDEYSAMFNSIVRRKFGFLLPPKDFRDFRAYRGE